MTHIQFSANSAWMLICRRSMSTATTSQPINVNIEINIGEPGGFHDGSRLVAFPKDRGEHDRWMEASSMRFALARGML